MKILKDFLEGETNNGALEISLKHKGRT